MLKRYVSYFVLENVITTITKKYAIAIGSKSWREGIEYKTTNIDPRFRATGMWPFYFLAVQRHENPTWIRCQETVWMEMLSLPP